MFKSEIKQKMKLNSELLDFCITMTGRDKLIVSGVKSVLTSNANLHRLRLASTVLEVRGQRLQIVEIGGGDVFVKGFVEGVSFEN